MFEELQDRVALITGGSKGIGKAIAMELASRGAICLLIARDLKRLQETAYEIKKISGKVEVYGADVSDYERISEIVREIEKKYERVDILINNAGIGLFASVMEMKIEDWDRVMNTNLTAVFYLTKQILPVMMRNEKGIIINIASLAGKNSFVGGSAYCASKAGLIAFSECLMLEVRNYNIKVGLVLPGSVATEFSDKSDANWMLLPEDVAKQVINIIESRDKSLVSYIEMRPLKPIK